MKAVFQNYSTGQVDLIEVPAPLSRPNCVLVAVRASLISVGTERAMMEIARKSLLGKALARPDWVKQVIDKVQSDGLLETYRQARARLDLPVPLGYSAAGVVLETGQGVTGVAAGDRVACGGHPHASHAEVLCVPRNLCVPIPDGVSFEDASYVMLGAIALNAVRLAEPALGERVAVIGLGLLGLLAVQMLRASGCRVLGIDVAADKLELARQLGAAVTAAAQDDVAAVAREFTGGAGVDTTLIFAAADSNAPVEQAAAITREQGKVLVPGLVKLELPRKVFFEKELRLVVPRAGGPGAADPGYENRGIDLPLPFVRWTEGRNLSAFLELVADGRVRVAPLTTHRFPIERALEAYALLERKTPAERPPTGIVLTYPGATEPARVVHLAAPKPQPSKGPTIGVGLVGAGLFTRGVFIPILRKAGGLTLRGVATASGATARHAAETAGFAYCASDYRELLNDSAIDAVLIVTRHDLHARLASEALAAGKHVFVEKPLALNEEELRAVLAAYRAASPGRILMVGFNRRFAPATQSLLAQLGSGPAVVQCSVNAGAVPASSWVQDEQEGGGRIIGEVCHFVDLVHALGGGLTASVAAVAMSEQSERPMQDTVAIMLRLDNGSIGSITYAANGDKSFPRERIEVFRGGAVGVIDNFRGYSLTRAGKTRRWKSMSLDRGHSAELQAFFDGIRRGRSPVDVEDYATTTLATFCIERAIAERSLVLIDPFWRAAAGEPE